MPLKHGEDLFSGLSVEQCDRDNDVVVGLPHTLSVSRNCRTVLVVDRKLFLEEGGIMTCRLLAGPAHTHRTATLTGVAGNTDLSRNITATCQAMALVYHLFLSPLGYPLG